jgi:hypothetical protein
MPWREPGANAHRDRLRARSPAVIEVTVFSRPSPTTAIGVPRATFDLQLNVRRPRD